MKAFLLALVGSAHFSTCDGFVNNRFPLNKALFSTTDTVDAEIVDKEIEIDTTSKLKVPNTSWRWPIVWPFPGDFLETGEAITEEQSLIDFSLIEDYIKHYKAFSSESESVLRIGTAAVINSLEDQKDSLSFEGLDSNAVELPFAKESFDKVVVLSGVEGLVNPKDYFREIWKVLKPGGTCFTFFSTKPMFLEEGSNVIKMWQTMSDEQKIWIAGSYFHYSAVGGWENIEGWDVTGETGSEVMEFKFNNVTEGGEVQRLAYAVQSSKIVFPTIEESSTDVESLATYFAKQMLSLKNMVRDDQRFSALRLATRYFDNGTYVPKEDPSFSSLEKIYDVLKDVKEIVVPSPVKAMLAAMLIEEWDSSPVQTEALKMALGLAAPSEEFWLPLSKSTTGMPPKEKIYFTADLVAKFGKEEYSTKLASVPVVLATVVEQLVTRFPSIDLGKVQSFATDLVISDYLKSEAGSEEKLVKFVQTFPIKSLQAMIVPPVKK